LGDKLVDKAEASEGYASVLQLREAQHELMGLIKNESGESMVGFG
jgi:hypothetical protein